MQDESGFPLASIGRRFSAHAFDWLSYLAFFCSYLLLFGSLTAEGVLQVQGLRALPLIAGWWLIFAAPEAAFGRTLGKWLFDIQVRQENGEPVTTSLAFKRRLCDVVDFVFSFGIVAAVMSDSRRRQRLGDRVAGTVVVRT
jgi:uncharacterized RDD family membrane protein YckC